MAEFIQILDEYVESHYAAREALVANQTQAVFKTSFRAATRCLGALGVVEQSDAELMTDTLPPGTNH